MKVHCNMCEVKNTSVHIKYINKGRRKAHEGENGIYITNIYFSVCLLNCWYNNVTSPPLPHIHRFIDKLEE